MSPLTTSWTLWLPRREQSLILSLEGSQTKGSPNHQPSSRHEDRVIEETDFLLKGKHSLLNFRTKVPLAPCAMANIGCHGARSLGKSPYRKGKASWMKRNSVATVWILAISFEAALRKVSAGFKAALVNIRLSFIPEAVQVLPPLQPSPQRQMGN